MWYVNSVFGGVLHTERVTHVTPSTNTYTPEDYGYVNNGGYISLTSATPVSGKYLEQSLRRGTHRKV